MNKKLYILDFDRTIFDTDRFIWDLKAALQEYYGVPPEEFEATTRSYIEPETKYYNFHGHAASLTRLEPAAADEFVWSRLGGHDYAFPDAADWISRRDPASEQVIVMTVGRPPFQELKFRHTRAVRSIQKFVVQQNKGQLIRDYINGTKREPFLAFLDQPYSSIYLIDDSPETFETLGYIKQVHPIRIIRAGAKYSDLPTPRGIPSVTSFREIKKIC